MRLLVCYALQVLVDFMSGSQVLSEEPATAHRFE